MFLYHYFNKEIGPFLNLSDLSINDANALTTELKQKYPDSQVAQRDADYIFRRRMYEDIIKKEFIKKAAL